jgi:hypothetical protein
MKRFSKWVKSVTNSHRGRTHLWKSPVGGIVVSHGRVELTQYQTERGARHVRQDGGPSAGLMAGRITRDIVR